MAFIKKHIYITYTLGFLIIAALVFGPLFIEGRTLVWKNDGFMQYIRAVSYYGGYLRDVVRALLKEHTLVMPHFNFSLGEGADFTEALGYYCVGDPLALVFAVVPASHMAAAYAVMSVFRLYLAGVVFICLCLETKVARDFGTIIGAYVYVFAYWGILNAARHPYFLNALIYLPFILLGIERLINKKSPRILTVAVMLSCAASLYFFYMQVILVALYTVTRLGIKISQREFNIKDSLILIIRIAVFALLGILMAGVIFLPTLFTYMENARGGFSFAHHLLYPYEYYALAVKNLIVGGNGVDMYWLCLGFGIPAIACLVLLFAKKGRTLLKLLWVIGLVFSVFPIFGQLLNGNSYMCNRWSFALALLMGYTVAVTVPELTGYFEKKLPAVLVKVLVLVLFTGSIAFNGYWLFSGLGEGYAAELKTKFEIDNTLNANETQAVLNTALAENYTEPYRFAARSPIYNAGMSQGLSGIQYYWSISNPYLASYRREMAFLEGNTFNHQGYDNRAGVMALSNVRYYTVHTPDASFIPFGYEYEATEFVRDSVPAECRYDVYRNAYQLPIGYLTESYVSRESWEKLDYEGRDEVMTAYTVLDEAPEGILEAADYELPSSIDFKVEAVDNRTEITENKIRVFENDGCIRLNFDGLENSETRVMISGLDFEPADKEAFYQSMKTRAFIYFEGSNGTKETLIFKGRDDAHYEGRADYLANVGYTKEACDYITIRFAQAGDYSFEELKVYCQDMQKTADRLTLLGKNPMTEARLSNDRVTGRVKAKADSLLTIALPYSDGFSAFVDGKETKLYNANIRYMALVVPKGEHEIEIAYETPYMRQGLMLTILGFLIFIAAEPLKSRFFIKAA